MKKKLNAQNELKIKQLDEFITRISNIKNEIGEYKLGDIYLSEYYYADCPREKNIEKTTLGFPVKYEVVAISDLGIPYLRAINSKGYVGDVLVPPEVKLLAFLQENLHYLGYANDPLTNIIGGSYIQRFIPDPEQYDAILLQKEFNPVEQQIEATKLHNEIKKYNKSITIQTSGSGGYNAIANFFKAAKPGDVFWTAPNKHFVIQSVVKQGREWCVTVTDINQQTHTSNFNSFMYTRLYKAQPRSFKQEAKK